VFFQPAVVKNHDPDLFAPGKSPHTVVIDLLHMPDPVFGKVVLDIFKKCEFLPYAGNFIIPGFLGCVLTEIPGDLRMILPMLIKTGNLAPVYRSLLVRFPVKHVGVHATDGKPLVIYPAPVVVKKVAGPAIIVFGPESIPGYIECSFLVAKFRVRCRFNRFRINLPCPVRVTIKEEDVPVERPCTAPAAEIAAEPDLFYDRCQLFLRIREKIR
jgi:hypothetical protein